jgi:two-component system C4-dicarboxylate transport sensor histidine kinase DctB
MKNHIAAEEISAGKSSSVLGQLSSIVKRMESITHQLRFFATSGDDVSSTVDISSVTKSALSLVEHDIKRENIQVISSDLKTAHFVHGNKQRLEQVVINLFKNSIKAMSEAQEKIMSISIKQDDQMVRLIIEDTGCGLMGQSLEQIVEPFHTTGPSGEGMGLGLAISASIIHEHSGILEARDKAGGGAVFEMAIPKKTDQIPI